MTFQVFHDLYERIFSLTPISWSCSGNIGETRSSRPIKAIRAVMSKRGVTDKELGSGSHSSRRSRVLSRVFEGQKLPPPKNIVISTVDYSGKIIQTRRGQCAHRNISQNCLKMHQIASQRTFISKNFRGGILTLGTSPPDDKSQIEP